MRAIEDVVAKSYRAYHLQQQMKDATALQLGYKHILLVPRLP